MKRAISEKEMAAGTVDKVFNVTREMVLTPGAREYASRLGITLKYGQEPPRQSAPPADDLELARLIEQIVTEEIIRKQPAAGGGSAPVPERAAQAVAPAVLSEEAKCAILGAGGEREGGRAIVTVLGANQPGIVARISAAVAECGGDLADMSQVIVDRFFSLIFIVNLEGLERCGSSFRLFKERLQDEAARIGSVQILVMHEGIFKAMHKV